MHLHVEFFNAFGIKLSLKFYVHILCKICKEEIPDLIYSIQSSSISN